MFKEWMTVVHYHNGRAILRYNLNPVCNFCFDHSMIYEPFFFNKKCKKNEHYLEVSINQNLVIGQKVEIGISKGSLLRSAMIVYLTPLFGLFIVSGITNFLFLNQLITFLTGIIGAAIGFFLAKKIMYCEKKKRQLYHPIIIQIALPSDDLKINMNAYNLFNVH